MHNRSLKKRWPLVVGLTLLVSLVLVTPVAAAEIFDDETLVIDEDEVIEDDMVWAGQTLTVDGTIEGDLVAAGQEIVVNGSVEGDLIAAGMSVTVNGQIGGDTYVGAYLIKLGEDAGLTDELMVGGYSLEAAKGSMVGDDLLFGAFQALLGSDIVGDVKGGGEGVQIDGSVGGDVDVDVGNPATETDYFNFAQFNPQLPPVASVPAGLTVSDDASIGGDLSYSSEGASDIPSGVVAGKTDFNRVIPEAEGEEEFEFRPTRPGAAVGFLAGQFVLKLVRRFLTLVLVGLLIIWLGRKALTATVDTFKARPWVSLGMGFLGYAVVLLALALIPWLLIVLGILLGVISLGGLTTGVIAFGSLGWFGLFIGFLTAVSWLAKIVLAVWLGQLIWKAIQPEGTSLIPPLLIGVAIAALLTAIPFLGGVVGFLIALFGLGALILTGRAGFRSPGEAGEPAAAAV